MVNGENQNPNPNPSEATLGAAAKTITLKTADGEIFELIFDFVSVECVSVECVYQRKRDEREGDSTVIINALLHGVGDMASFCNILDDIRMHSAVFQFVEYVHVNRSCNAVADALAKKAKSAVADALAKKAKSDVGVQVWLNDLPADIAPLVLRDVH
ncbi:hypothetical protein SO802_007757 [Lithocarpus litseifolius]|uniref:RNase H type-1 domain-containing protein n=1 Tax=Lithocarpus litseifolius TaxID=425828 RepID=A0AAW2DR74_9ROSI